MRQILNGFHTPKMCPSLPKSVITAKEDTQEQIMVVQKCHQKMWLKSENDILKANQFSVFQKNSVLGGRRRKELLLVKVGVQFNLTKRSRD